jgi:L-threonylcarbamoyladenylate synthase
MSTPEARVLSARTPELFDTAVREAALVLRRGGLVALPTETVYGLAANALDPRAVAAIFEAKGRPPHNPIIVHVSDITMARRCVRSWTPLAQALADAFWPGPLTLVLEKSDIVPDIVTAGGTTVGIRWPAHPIMRAVIRACGFPLAAPSANLSNRLSPTSAAHVFNQLGDKVPLIIDGGHCNVGIESTVLDITGNAPRILRPGMIHEEAIAAAGFPLGHTAPFIGASEAAGCHRGQPDESSRKAPLRSPGLLQKHYSPRARLVVWTWQDDPGLLALLAAAAIPSKHSALVVHSRMPAPHDFRRIAVVPRDPEAYARALYAELHACDDSGVELIIVEALPDGPEWRGLRDRLARAGTGAKKENAG